MDHHGGHSGTLYSVNQKFKRRNPGRGQIILETIVSGGHNFFKDTLGEHGAEYIPYLMTVTLYIGIANLIGLLGFKPPTKDMNATAALAFMSIVLIEVAGIRQKEQKDG